MDMRAIQIISIKKQLKNSSKYIINSDYLHKLLDPIEDKEVAIISIAGLSRTGKSFILNYIVRYLLNPLDIDWIGKPDDPLNGRIPLRLRLSKFYKINLNFIHVCQKTLGFEWKNDIEPQTTGIWLSTPFLIKQSNSNELAVILMDTQGVFDEFSTQKDWSTIVGISLMCSSCFIFNISNNIQEDILMILDSFLKYEFLATKTNNGSNSETPFESLMFLIRDWDSSEEYNYGLTGGKKFLDRKLEMKENQSPSTQEVRCSMNICFKDVSCFLLPDPGDKVKDDLDFNGSVAQINSRFVEKMMELITSILNPSYLKPKMINNSHLTGSDLCEYLKAYVQMFNCKDLPKPINIVEANAKAADLIQIKKLKVFCLNRMRTFLQTKSFIAIRKLENHKNVNKKETIDTFIDKKKTTNEEIEKELFELLHKSLYTIYEQIFNENEQRRDNTLTESVENCGKLFLESISKRFDSICVDNSFLDEVFIQEKKKVIDLLTDNYGEEDNNLFSMHYLKLTKIIENSENALRSKNNRRILEAERNNTKAVIDSIEFYDKTMVSLLGQNIFLNKEEFSLNEADIRVNARHLLRQNCTFGDSNLIKKFELEFELKLMEVKSKWKSLNHNRRNKTIISIKNESKNSLTDYSNKMNIIVNSIYSQEELIEKNEIIKYEIINQFKDNCLYKNEAFLKPYIEELETELNKALIEFEYNLSNRIEKVLKSYKNAVTEINNLYIKDMELLLTVKKFYTEEELNNFHENNRNKAIHLFKNITDSVNKQDFEYYLHQVEETVCEEFIKFRQNNELRTDIINKDLENMTNEFLKKYEEQMEEHIESVYSESELLSKHDQIKEYIIKEFTIQFPEASLFDRYIDRLEDMIGKSLDILNKLRTDSIKKDLEEMTNEFLTKYDDKMKELIESVDGHSELLSKHEEIKEKIINEFSELNQFLDSSLFYPYIEKLEDMIKESFQDSLELLEVELKKQDSIAKNLVLYVREFYKKEMDKYYENTSFHLYENLRKINDSVVNRAIIKYKTERGNMSLEKYKKLLTDSIEDIYVEIREKNAMSTPTIPAIGIDLGTTKPDRNGGKNIVIRNELGSKTTASVVAFTYDQEIVGDVAKEEAYFYPRNTIFLAKGLIGRKYNDTSVQNDIKLWPNKVVDDGNNNPLFSVNIEGNEKTFYPEEKLNHRGSVEETDRLFTHIKQLKPHIIIDTLSLNDARKNILCLTKPLADISQNIQSNISVVEDKKKQVLCLKESEDELGFPEKELKKLIELIPLLKEMNILVLGVTGVGKSTWINGIINYMTYPSLESAAKGKLLSVTSASFQLTDDDDVVHHVQVGEDKNEIYKPGKSVTQKPKAHIFPLGDTLVRLIDTPGIGDTSGYDQDKKNFDAILQYLSTLDILHGICILLKPNESRLDVLFQFCVKELLTHLHQSASENIVFCFTNSRGTNYKPGDTRGPLTELLKQNQVEITLNKNTMYCMDNESFRFLCAVKQGIQFKKSIKKSFSESWNISVEETDRLFTHIKQLKPHIITDTLSLNDARKNILCLTKPLADISQNIQSNISVVEDKKKQVLCSKESEDELAKGLYIYAIELVRSDLAHPRTVCTNQKCVKYHNVGVGKTMAIEYVKHCHPRCYLKGVPTEIVGDKNLKECKAMNGELYCTECLCCWDQHMHLTYEQKRVPIRIVDDSIQTQIKNKETARKQIELFIQNMENYCKEQEVEQKKITEVSAKFGRFLSDNAIIPYNDVLGRYFDHRIKEEEEKSAISKGYQTLNRLKDMRKAYDKEVEEAMSQPNSVKLSPSDIKELMAELFALKHNGKQLEEAMKKESLLKSKMMEYNESYYGSKKQVSKPGLVMKSLNYLTSLWSNNVK